MTQIKTFFQILSCLFLASTFMINIQTEARGLFLPSRYVNFSPNKFNPEIFGTQDLRISVENFDQIPDGSECAFWRIQYGEEDPLVLPVLYADYQNGKCEVTFPANEQVAPGWDFKIDVTDSRGQRFTSETSYLFRAGALGLSEIYSTKL